MSVKDVYLKTMKFVWLKLAMGCALILYALITFAITWGLMKLIPTPILLYVWVIQACCVTVWVSRYVGYMLKAGHVAIVSTAVTSGEVPADYVKVGKDMVAKRFLTSNVYFAVDGLVSGAVSQLQKGLQKVDNLFGEIPGVSTVISFLQLFVSIALGYVDECCLGYTFLHPEQSAFKSAADGVVIYFQNWKTLLKDAAVTTLIVMVVTFVAWVVPFVVLLAILGVFEINATIAILLAILCAYTIKYAFVDSYMMVKMMVSYMQVAPTTEITFDLYNKLCGLSAKFKSLFQKGQAEQTGVAA
ncbi:MAG: hypothetical protein II994_00945 [Lachnospiraceae bacterium]|nr:hypothetical protein [Lachnospiraceae bacterium]